ncbi:hypothetical protein FEP59_06482 [Burkholderia multivorans]|nr:hypothetical protein [Burkholderia multivorans]
MVLPALLMPPAPVPWTVTPPVDVPVDTFTPGIVLMVDVF